MNAGTMSHPRLIRSHGAVLALLSLVLLPACDDGQQTLAGKEPPRFQQPRGVPSPLFAELAGDYTTGFGGLAGEWLTVRDDGICRYDFQGCVGGSQFESSMAVDGPFLVARDTRSSSEPSMNGVHPLSRYLVIRWSRRVYLVREDEILRFCNDVNQGAEPRAGELGSFLMRKDGIGTPVSGRPQLPDDWQPWVLEHPLAATTTEPLADGTSWIDLGSEHGLRPGMWLVLRDVPVSAEVIALGAEPFRDAFLAIEELLPRRSRVQHALGPPGLIRAGLRVEIGQELPAP